MHRNEPQILNGVLNKCPSQYSEIYFSSAWLRLILYCHSKIEKKNVTGQPQILFRNANLSVYSHCNLSLKLVFWTVLWSSYNLFRNTIVYYVRHIFICSVIIIFLAMIRDTTSGCTRAYTEKTTFPFPFKSNWIWLWWQFSFRFWTKYNSIWFKVERKTVTTIISHSIWKEMTI